MEEESLGSSVMSWAWKSSRSDSETMAMLMRAWFIAASMSLFRSVWYTTSGMGGRFGFAIAVASMSSAKGPRVSGLSSAISISMEVGEVLRKRESFDINLRRALLSRRRGAASLVTLFLYSSAAAIFLVEPPLFRAFHPHTSSLSLGVAV